MKRLLTTLLALFLTAGLLLPSQTAHAQATTDGAGTASPDDADGIVVVGEDEETDEEDDADASTDAAPQEEDPSLSVSVGGSLRFNALFRSYGADAGSFQGFEDKADRKLGDGGFTFDTFRINASGSYGGLIFDTEYAIYPDAFGGLYIHHGWVGYEFSDAFQTQVGVSQVPFGIQPYASSSWFFNNTYYVGLEDDYDAGIKFMYQTGPWDVQAAYYMNPEGTTFYGSSNAARYSYDVVPQGRSLSEENQFNGKVAYSFDHGDLGFTKVGVSGQYGQLLNESTGDTDSHSAYAGHVQGRYGGFGAKLEVAQQELNPPVDGNTDFVTMGAYGGTYSVASEHTVFSSSLSYRIPVDAGPISQIKPYYDYSLVTKNVDGWEDNESHIVGFLTSAGPLFVYTDLIISKNHPFNAPFAENYGDVMAQGISGEFRTAFNINIGLYF
ncbi:MAG: hypothetical protein ABEK75_03120 [Salinibacter sp.]